IASRMCLIPSCSPLAEINRTERARISPLILGSSSVATVHHSSQRQIFGAVCPPDDILAKASNGRAPQLPQVIILRVRCPCPYRITRARRPLGGPARQTLRPPSPPAFCPRAFA